MRLPDPRRSRAVLIGTGRYADKKLPDLPVVDRTLGDLAATLSHRIRGVVTKTHCALLQDEGDIRLIGRHLRSAARGAEDLLLVYFVGHGLVGGRRHELYLGLPDSEWAEPEFNSLEYDKLRSSVLDSAAATKIIILDCCFSGRAVSETMADPVTEMVGQIEVDGTYVLTSAGRDQVALIRPGEDYTAFTGRFLHLLRTGVPGGPELLSVDYLYQQLVTRMRAEGLSQPQKRATSTADLLALAVNPAFAAAQTSSAHTRPGIPATAGPPATQATAGPPAPAIAYVTSPLPSQTEAALVGPSHLARTLAGHDGGVLGVAFSPDGHLLATASRDCTARVWDAATGEHLRTLTGHIDQVWQIAFSPDGRLIATASSDKRARLWDPATGEDLRTLTGHTKGIRAVAFSPDGGLIATASEDKTARVWDAATGRHLRTLPGHKNQVFGVAFSPDGRLIATTSWDSRVRVWDAATGERLRSLRGHTSSVFGVAFSPDGRLLATASSDSTARLWDPATGEHLRTLTGHTSSVFGVAFSPDGHLLATAGYDGTARLWDPATGEHLRTLTGHDSPVDAVAFNPDGHLLATAGADEMARVWD